MVEKVKSQIVDLICLTNDVSRNSFYHLLEIRSVRKGSPLLSLSMPDCTSSDMAMNEFLESSSVFAENDIFSGTFAIDVSSYEHRANHRFFRMLMSYIRSNPQIEFILYSIGVNGYKMPEIEDALRKYEIRYQVTPCNDLNLEKNEMIRKDYMLGY